MEEQEITTETLDERREKRLQKQAKQQRRKKLPRPATIILVLVICLMAATSVRNIVTLELEHRRLTREHEELTARRDRLKIELKNVNSKEYVEQQARRQLRLVNPDEILFVFPEEEVDEDSDS